MSATVTEAHREKAEQVVGPPSDPLARAIISRVAQALADAEAAERTRIVRVISGFYDPEGGMIDHLDACREIATHIALGNTP